MDIFFNFVCRISSTSYPRPSSGEKLKRQRCDSVSTEASCSSPDIRPLFELFVNEVLLTQPLWSYLWSTQVTHPAGSHYLAAQSDLSPPVDTGFWWNNSRYLPAVPVLAGINICEHERQESHFKQRGNQMSTADDKTVCAPPGGDLLPVCLL